MNNFEYISRGRVYKVNHFRTIQINPVTRNLLYEISGKPYDGW